MCCNRELNRCTDIYHSHCILCCLKKLAMNVEYFKMSAYLWVLSTKCASRLHWRDRSCIQLEWNKYTKYKSLRRKWLYYFNLFVFYERLNNEMSIQLVVDCLSFSLTAIFPGGPVLAGTRMSPFCILLDWAKDDGGEGDSWSYKTLKTLVESSPPTNQHPVFTDRMPFPSLNQVLKHRRIIQ